MRCIHEAALWKQNAFITLTYNDEHIPQNGSLRYEDWQAFMRRLRYNFERPRFYMCGEYGEKLGRPHFHACLFNINFEDKIFYKVSPSGETLYRSPTLEKLWPYGYSSIGDLTFESAAYVARYIMEKRTGPEAELHYQKTDTDTGESVSLEPEFTSMSLKPGIGADWFHQYRTDVYPHDYVIVRGKKMKPPRSYDRWLKQQEPGTWECVEHSRLEKMRKAENDNTPARLKVREQVARARNKPRNKI